MKPIQDYLEYRDYLRDFYREKKERSPFFSYRYMSGKVGMDASHLVKIFQKQRHIADAAIDTIVAFCGLHDRDAAYFTTLVHFNKAKSDRDIKRYYEQLLKLKSIEAVALSKDQQEYYRKWYYSAVLTLLDFYIFDGDYRALAARLDPPITVPQARKAIDLLRRLRLVTEDDTGRLILTNNILTSGDGSLSSAVKVFQAETIRLAGESLAKHPREERNISTVTITLDRNDLGTINEMIRAFRAELLKFARETNEPDRVYQLNIQLFPVTV